MGTLQAVGFEALGELAEEEADFLGVLLRDLLREARIAGHARLEFREFELRARSEALGGRLLAISWCLTKYGVPVARDVAIQYR